ncbi:MAG: hypothetical protein AAF959_13490 [Cyanobacteria bacterium P01_D01_bin.56]
MSVSTKIQEKQLKLLGCVGAVAVVLGLSSLWLLAPNWMDNRNPLMQEHMAEVAWQWGNFAPIPPSAQGFQIVTSGSSFSRTFSGSFAAEQAVLERWIQDSPGLNFDEGAQLESGHIRYTIETKNGFGSVELDPTNNIIYFQVSWS